MNIVALIGNVAGEPELRHTQQERAVCTFRVAVSRHASEGADFFTVVAWERTAEVCAEFLQVGRRVAVEGRLHHSTWEVDGQRRSKVEIVASRVQLMGPRRAPTQPRSEQPTAADTPFPGPDTPPAATPPVAVTDQEAELAPA